MGRTNALVALAHAVPLSACLGPSAGAAGRIATVDGGQTDASASEAPVVGLRTGPDSSCGGQHTHAWPVGMNAADGHGWRAVHTSGRAHDNSANDLRCNPDGSFSFVQFAGNLNCAGSGVRKDYVLDVCEQDTPPSLYTAAFDLTCCRAPSDPMCKTALPSVSVAGGAVVLNRAAGVTR